MSEGCVAEFIKDPGTIDFSCPSLKFGWSKLFFIKDYLRDLVEVNYVASLEGGYCRRMNMKIYASISEYWRQIIHVVKKDTDYFQI